MDRLGSGFYAVVVCFIVLSLSFNLLYIKYKKEKDDKIQWKLLNLQLKESKQILDESVYNFLQSKLIIIKEYIRDSYPLIYKLFWSDFVILILIRIFMVIISIPLFLIFIMLGILEGVISRNKKAITFKIYSVYKYKWSKRFIILMLFVPFSFYISFPYYIENMFYISTVIIYSILSLLIFNTISNLPKGL